MYKIIVRPAGTSSAKHFAKSIANKIDIRNYKNCFDPNDYDLVMKVFPDGLVNVWGNTNGSANSKGFLNENKWKKITYNDVQLFVGNKTIKAYSETALTLKCKKFAEALWGTNKAGETWENLSFLKNIVLTNVPSIYLNIYLGYKFNNNFAGFTVTDKMYKGFRDTYFNAYKPSAMFIEKFKVVNNLPPYSVLDKTLDNLKNSVQEIKAFHKGSIFDVRTAQGSANAGKALVYDISLELAPNDTKNKADMDKFIKRIEKLAKSFNISRIVDMVKLKQELKDILYVSIKQYVMNNRNDFSAVREMVFETMEQLLPSALKGLDQSPWYIYRYETKNRIDELAWKLWKNGCSTKTIDEIIDEVLNSLKHMQTVIVELCEHIISCNGDLSGIEELPKIMDALEKLGDQGKALKKAIMDFINYCMNSVVLGYFNCNTGIHLYYDRIMKLAESEYKEYIDSESFFRRYDYRRWCAEYSVKLSADDVLDAFLAKVAAHEMEHAWHYADIMTFSGTYHKFDYPECSWVSETIAEYFCYQYTKNMSAKANFLATKLVEARRTYLFPYEGGYAGALLLEKSSKELERFQVLYGLSLYEGRYAYYYVMYGLVKHP